MRVLHVCESLPGGPAAYLQDLIPDQVARFGRNQVSLLVPDAQVGFIATLTGPDGPRVDTYRRTGRNAASLLRLGLAVRRAVRRQQPDVVHLHSTFAGAVGRAVLVGLPRPSIVYCAHCWSFERTAPDAALWLYATIERLLARRTDLLIDISPHEPDLRRRRRIRPRRAALVVTGIGDAPPAAAVDALDGRPLRLLYVGRTDRQKGFDLLMAEFARLDPGRATLTVVGAGVLRDLPVEISPAVTVFDWVDRGEVAGMIASADVVVMPSRWEGMPILALEVLRSGRPLLTSRTGPFGSVVDDGVNGLLMDIGQPGFLGRALDRLRDMDLRAMGRAARATFEQRFRIERMHAELADAYAGLPLGRGGAEMVRPALLPARAAAPTQLAEQPPSPEDFGHNMLSAILLAGGCLALSMAGSRAEAARPADPVARPAWALALADELAPLQALAQVDERLWAGLPTVRLAAPGRRGDADSAPIIQRALDRMTGGGTLVLGPGTFRQSRCITLSNPNVRLMGQGATIEATNADDLCLAVVGDGDVVQGLTLTAPKSPRGLDTRQARILLRGSHTVIAGNTIRGATSAGVWVQGARRYAVVGNHISGTMADGIYSAEGARQGYVAGNVLDRTGDDGVSVVSYHTSARSGEILVENNSVSNVVSARGLSVVGSESVIVRRNRVDGTGRAAGIIVTREPSFDTNGVDRVVVEGNSVAGVARLQAPDQTGQASIDLNAYEAPTPDLQLRRVLVAGNTITDGRTGGIRVLGGACGIAITGNTIHDVAGDPIAAVEPTCGPPIGLCRGNVVDQPAALPAACRGGG